MARGSFLVKGGKGKVGFGERQITPNEIVSLGLDNSNEIFVINKQLQGLSLFNKRIYSNLIYDRVPVLVVKKENFSNSTYFNPNPYLILKNEKNEFFFGVDSSKPNSRFNPSGTLIKLETGASGRTTSIIPTFYCPADERAVYKDSKVTFYKLYPFSPNTTNFNFSNALMYSFTSVREDFSKNNGTLDLALIDVSPKAPITANEIKAEVKNDILYVTVKNAKTSDLSAKSFLICQLPIGYRPSREINVSLFNQLGEVFMGTLSTNGALTVIVNGKTKEGLYLHTSIPVLDIRDQGKPITKKL